MKLRILGTTSLIALGLFVTTASADVVRRQTTTETIAGTVSEVTPSSQIVVTSSTGAPTTYRIDQKTVFVDEQGNVVSYEQVRGQPVKVYVTESKEQPVVVERVVVTKPVERVIEQRTVIPAPAPPPVVNRTETRTETRTEIDD